MTSASFYAGCSHLNAYTKYIQSENPEAILKKISGEESKEDRDITNREILHVAEAALKDCATVPAQTQKKLLLLADAGIKHVEREIKKGGDFKTKKMYMEILTLFNSVHQKSGKAPPKVAEKPKPSGQAPAKITEKPKPTITPLPAKPPVAAAQKEVAKAPPKVTEKPKPTVAALPAQPKVPPHPAQVIATQLKTISDELKNVADTFVRTKKIDSSTRQKLSKIEHDVGMAQEAFTHIDTDQESKEFITKKLRELSEVAATDFLIIMPPSQTLGLAKSFSILSDVASAIATASSGKGKEAQGIIYKALAQAQSDLIILEVGLEETDETPNRFIEELEVAYAYAREARDEALARVNAIETQGQEFAPQEIGTLQKPWIESINRALSSAAELSHLASEKLGDQAAPWVAAYKFIQYRLEPWEKEVKLFNSKDYTTYQDPEYARGLSVYFRLREFLPTCPTLIKLAQDLATATEKEEAEAALLEAEATEEARYFEKRIQLPLAKLILIESIRSKDENVAMMFSKIQEIQPYWWNTEAQLDVLSALLKSTYTYQVKALFLEQLKMRELLETAPLTPVTGLRVLEALILFDEMTEKELHQTQSAAVQRQFANENQSRIVNFYGRFLKTNPDATAKQELLDFLQEHRLPYLEALAIKGLVNP